MLVGQLVNITGILSAVNGIPISELNGFRMITNVTATTFKFSSVTVATSTGTGGGSGVTLEQDPEGSAIANQDALIAFGPIDTFFASNGVGFRMRFQIVPSQAEVANGAFYLIGHLPHSGQTGIIALVGGVLQLQQLPTLTVGQTFDDVVPRPDLFVLVGASQPFFLQSYVLPGPVLTTLFCGITPCINISSCSHVVNDIGDVCV